MKNYTIIDEDTIQDGEFADFIEALNKEVYSRAFDALLENKDFFAAFSMRSIEDKAIWDATPHDVKTLLFWQTAKNQILRTKIFEMHFGVEKIDEFFGGKE